MIGALSKGLASTSGKDPRPQLGLRGDGGTKMFSKRRQRGALVSLGLLLALTATPGAFWPGASSAAAPGAVAPAVTCSASNHCYGRAYFTSYDPNYVRSITVYLRVTCMGPTSPTSQVVTEETWLDTEGSVAGYWVETGFTMGAGSPSPSSLRFFWADKREFQAYSEHWPNITASFNHNTTLEIYQVSDQTWNIYINGNVAGVSTQNPGPSYEALAGEEITANTAKGAGYFYSLNWVGRTGGASSTWPNARLQVSSPPTASWVTAGKSLKAYSNCAAPSTAHVKSADDFKNRPISGPTEGQVRVTSTQAVKAAKEQASMRGDSEPKEVRVVQTTRDRADATLFGAGGADDNSVSFGPNVYVVQMTGSFTNPRAPSNRTAPTGSVLTVIIDATTGEMTDSNLTDSGSAANLSALGSVTVSKP